MRINKTKNIGKVIYIVEGEKKEFNLLKHFFTKIFDYTVVGVPRQNKVGINDIEVLELYTSKVNIHSKVFILNSKSSNIKSINNGGDYLDNIYRKLYEKFGLVPDNASIFYIFDRD